MFKKFLAIALSVLVSNTLGATQAWASPYAIDQIRVSLVRGDVQICDQSRACAPAEVGRILKEGETVKTAAGAMARLQYGNKDTFDVRERSRVMVDQITQRGSRFQLFIGAFKAKVGGGLFKRRDVSVVTPVGVMAVRGTEFVLNCDQSGNTRVDVLYGRVDLVDPNTGKTRDNFIQGESGTMKATAKRDDSSSGSNAGQGSKEGKGAGSSDKGKDKDGGEDKDKDGQGEDKEGGDEQGQEGDEQAGQDQGESGDQTVSSDGAGAGGDEEGDRGGVEFLGSDNVEKGDISAESFAEAFGGIEGFESYTEAREQTLQKADDFASNEAEAVNDIVTTVQEDGIESGRVLRDRFGNIAQVQQMLLRPSGSEIQFINLVKRDQYTYSGYFTPATLASGARYDYLETTIAFNKSLPDSLAEWPSFFVDNSDTIKVQSMKTEVTNAVKGNSKRDYMTFEARYDSAKDELGSTECTGSAALGSACFVETIIGFVDGSNSGKWRVTDCNSSNCNDTEQTVDGEATGDMFTAVETPLNVELEYEDTLGLITAAGGASAPELWMLFEGYGIDTSGSLLNVDIIESANITDPFSFLKSVAGQVVISARYGSYNKSTNSGGTDLFRRGNIDLVVIPDLMVDLVQKYAASLADGL
ncbi:MAG: FecR domain-containing protein [Elusimicrobia bacterium]|nr:FecR domain-containing protein [Elusimicrobiota bacterium]